jgi:hypothetical protein
MNVHFLLMNSKRCNHFDQLNVLHNHLISHFITCSQRIPSDCIIYSAIFIIYIFITFYIYKFPFSVVYNACRINNGGCSHICTSRGQARHCTCNPGYSLAFDEETCTGKKQYRRATSRMTPPINNFSFFITRH